MVSQSQDLPAAFGFLASARPSGGRIPPAAFATRGTHTGVELSLRSQTLGATLVHAPGLPPDSAQARDTDTAVLIAGEIYNRDDLYSVLGPKAGQPGGDAQLLLDLLRRYGPHAFRLVNGRFAAVVSTGRRVLLASDHAGSVPLYVCAGPGEVTASTEAKTLAGHGGPRGFPFADARRVRGLPGVYQVPAGAVMDIGLDSGTAEIHRTWAPPLARRIMDEDDAVAAVRTALDRAVGARIAPGGTPLVVLSGGIDSSGVAALAHRAAGSIDSLSMGTDVSDEFAQARAVADHLGTRHREITVPTADLLRQLPYTVWAAESEDPHIIEYLLPLVALYRALDGPARRVLTGYGADIPLAGMHREDRLPNLDTAVAYDMATYDGLNEMSPVLSTLSGHWSTHPYWDRDVLDLLVSLEAGLKRRYGRDKWVLRAAMAELLPEQTVTRPKLGVHEGSGTTSSFSLLLLEEGVPERSVDAAKQQVVRELFDRTVVAGQNPGEVSTAEVVRQVADRLERGAA
ncbi:MULTISPECIES: asparagine synthase-related protein [unclassified Streptomyces]|uniref:asparagine synthase-related protein n=1 Tax=unclassified Streptomyces TaxID=2593676 RepID=UPI002E7FF073|nr:asparagine synthase-related protein [Streptomyces sp. NBC_00589]WTI37332.1 asparagine synthase-related protein [Streptomyces sp. NBC_00775]WUB28991.1 asparagine synthase-related protein [Streptomyces sp. NBC_00589]